MVWQVIKRLFGNLLPWLLAALLGFSVYQYAQANRYEAERDAAVQQADMLRSALAWQKRQADALNNALSQRDMQMQRIAEGITAHQQTLDALERNDEPTRDWSAEPVPAGVAEWLRQLPADSPDV